MELKPGYKQTEVGVIPEDWDVKRLGKIVILRSERIDPRKSGIQEFCVELEHIGSATGSLLGSKSTGEESSLKSVFRAGDVLFGKLRAYLRKYWRADRSGVCSTEIWVLSPIEDHISGPYLFQIVQTDKFIEAASSSYGTHMPRSDWNVVKSYELPFPPIKAEQEAIAEALSDADALIESLEQLITKKRHIKQGAMQELLTGKKRLPGFRAEWEETSLLELANGKKELFDDGDWIESEHITSEGIRLIQTGNIGVGQFVEKEIKKYILESSFVLLRCKELREGDLLICRLAEPAGRACVLPNIGEPKIVTSVDVTIFRPPSSTSNRIFLANLFSTNQWFREVSDRSGGTTHKRISRGALGHLKIRIPGLPEQTAIAAILSDMDAEIAALETKLAKTRSLKQGMMHNLLTGKIRLL